MRRQRCEVRRRRKKSKEEQGREKIHEGLETDTEEKNIKDLRKIIVELKKEKT